MIELIKKIAKHGFKNSIEIFYFKLFLFRKKIKIKVGYYNFSLNSNLLNFFPRRIETFILNCKLNPDINFNKANLWKPETINVLGYNLSIKDNVKWNFCTNPITKTYPKIFEGELFTSDFKKYGDYRINWELNRHHYFIWLSQHFFLTENEQILNKLKLDWNSWIDENPIGIGVNYKSSMEISIRLLNWVICLLILNKNKSYQQIVLNKKFIDSVLGQVLYLKDNLTVNLKKGRNNHSIIELAGLICLQNILRWKKLPDLDKLFKLLIDELKIQFYDDGVNFEHSPTYSRLTIESLLCILIIFNDKSYSKEKEQLKNLCHKYLRSLINFVTPENSALLFSDSDDGRILILDPNSIFNDFRGFFDFCGLYFNDEDLFISGNIESINEETKWWCFLSDTEILIPRKTKKRVSNFFSDSGYWIYNSQNIYFAFKSGYLGNKNLEFEYAPHVHNDLLSFILFYKGKPFFVDSGTFTYDLSDNNFRSYFRSSEAHSVIAVNKCEQFSHIETFRAVNLPKTELNRIDECTFEGCVEINNGVILKRKVKISDDIQIEFSDVVEKITNGTLLETYFILHPDVKLDIRNSEISLENFGVKLKITLEKNNFDIRVNNSWISDSYNHKIKNEKIILSIVSNYAKFENNWLLKLVNN